MNSQAEKTAKDLNEHFAKQLGGLIISAAEYREAYPQAEAYEIDIATKVCAKMEKILLPKIDQIFKEFCNVMAQVCWSLQEHAHAIEGLRRDNFILKENLPKTFAKGMEKLH